MLKSAKCFGRYRESRAVEFKRSENWDSLKAKIVKSSMAMSNLSDGGLIIIGIDEDNKKYQRGGLKSDHLASYSYDIVLSYINSYAEPHISLNYHLVEDPDNELKKFIVLDILSFSLVPTICAKDGIENLRKGAIYIRSTRIPETAEIRSYSEMRELIDLATERSIRKFLGQMQRLDLTLKDQMVSSAQMFENELNGL
ncbi:helix-turn-helix domain-containing protein [Leptospira adleri]|uniref:Schlafen AlbA-2 domain-containing protein n=1 Tax=Leptospira adleri TaxID=2023186 RepID=A0ABX4NT67_9LEPT|nr:ATP-binding protein [Leptospira adleri]PJZ59459.1 hypothetical protein CH376_23615 [Leptospira adleri]